MMPARLFTVAQAIQSSLTALISLHLILICKVVSASRIFASQMRLGSTKRLNMSFQLYSIPKSCHVKVGIQLLGRTFGGHVWTLDLP